jgi:undecaprenyl-diphosphatase
MTILQAAILGIVQGLTEFLPISSTAHLAVIPWVLGWSLDPNTAFAFDVLVQLGTLLAVIVFFWRDLWKLILAAIRSLASRSLADPMARLAWLLAIATIPGVIAGLALKKVIAGTLQEPVWIGFFLVCTGCFLFWASRTKSRKELNKLTVADAVWIGLGQVVALFPGASRSGWTIGSGLLRGMDRLSATRFAFLMAVPIMLGAGLVESIDVIHNPALLANAMPILVGFITAAIVGFLAIAGFLSFLRSHALNLFAAYCLIAGAAVILLRLVRG